MLNGMEAVIRSVVTAGLKGPVVVLQALKKMLSPRYSPQFVRDEVSLQLTSMRIYAFSVKKRKPEHPLFTKSVLMAENQLLIVLLLEGTLKFLFIETRSRDLAAWFTIGHADPCTSKSRKQ